MDREPCTVTGLDTGVSQRLKLSARETEKVRSFRDLDVGLRSMDLAIRIYRLTEGFPREEIFGLTSQLRRAAVSIVSNTAEGQGRNNTREFRQFLGVARGSVCELQTQLEIARALGFGDQKLLAEAEELSHRVAKMLFKLLSALQARLSGRE